VSAIWNFIYPIDGQNVLLTIASYLGIAVLLYGTFFKSKLNLYFSLLGLIVLVLTATSFYPNFWSWQRETLINPQYLFILFTVISLTMNVKTIKRTSTVKS
jgi:hypothetical protein